MPILRTIGCAAIICLAFLVFGLWIKLITHLMKSNHENWGLVVFLGPVFLFLGYVIQFALSHPQVF